jgi:hypothetical protein
VVLATGYAEISAKESLLCDHRLSKPFGIEQLQAVLAQIADRLPTPHNVVPLRAGS